MSGGARTQAVRETLPIDGVLPELCRGLAERGTLVLEAPPGAGKTTRVPSALVAAGLAGPATGAGECLVLEPRRLAARLAAGRVAEEAGEPLGRSVGYQVRFEDVSGPQTAIRYVTEGILTRRMVGDPTLKGVGVVLLDEFHERHLHGDVGLALLTRLQATTRPDLKLGVMSATLETDALRAYFERIGRPAAHLRSEGRRFPVEQRFAEKPDDRPLAQQVLGALKRLLVTPLLDAEGRPGSVLVFLPGAGEIARCLDICAEFTTRHGYDLLPLHGELNPEAQERAVRRGPKPRVVLSTNVAESSVTLDGVVAVVDAGLARVAGNSAWSGLPTLRLQKVSRASAIQRAGRAGRQGPGIAIRLYTEADFTTRPGHDEPEIRRSDLAQVYLEIVASGARPGDLPWFEAPPPQGLEAARGLLQRLSAIDANDTITTEGRRIVGLPVHPRLGRLVLEGVARGVGRDACALAALLGERDLRDARLFEGRGPTAGGATSDSDALDLLDLYRTAEARGGESLRGLGIHPPSYTAVQKATRALERSVRPSPTTLDRKGVDRALRMALLAAYPDRVGKRRTSTAAHAQPEERAKEIVFAEGGSARLGDGSAVRNEPWIVAIDAEERSPRPGAPLATVIQKASGIEPDWLLDLFPDAVTERVDVSWNTSLRRVDAVARMLFGALPLDESPAPPTAPEVAALLFQYARADGMRAVDPEARLERLRRRLSFAARSFPESGLRAPTDADVDAALRELCTGRRALAELDVASLESILLSAAGEGAHRLETLAPNTVVLPGGRRVTVEYEADQPPAISSRLQDFFGLSQGPSIQGRVPLVLHLLAPNHRDVQVTTDLSGFWQRHYPALRRELMRRYPRHLWPEDPLTATPPQRK